MKYLPAVNSGLKKGRLWCVHVLSLVSRPILSGGLGTRLEHAIHSCSQYSGKFFSEVFILAIWPI